MCHFDPGQFRSDRRRFGYPIAPRMVSHRGDADSKGHQLVQPVPAKGDRIGLLGFLYEHSGEGLCRVRHSFCVQLDNWDYGQFKIVFFSEDSVCMRALIICSARSRWKTRLVSIDWSIRSNESQPRRRWTCINVGSVSFRAAGWAQEYSLINGLTWPISQGNRWWCPWAFRMRPISIDRAWSIYSMKFFYYLLTGTSWVILPYSKCTRKIL